MLNRQRSIKKISRKNQQQQQQQHKKQKKTIKKQQKRRITTSRILNKSTLEHNKSYIVTSPQQTITRTFLTTTTSTKYNQKFIFTKTNNNNLLPTTTTFSNFISHPTTRNALEVAEILTTYKRYHGGKHAIFCEFESEEEQEEQRRNNIPPPHNPLFNITAAYNSLYNNTSDVLPLPTRVMTTNERSDYLKDCDFRSIQYGVQLIFGDWDQDLIVVNKPFGLPMAASHRDNITSRIKSILQHENVFPVHRLDKYTSGCLVIALNADVARVLQNSLQNHTLQSIKTTETNFKQKVKAKEIRDHLKNSIRESLQASGDVVRDEEAEREAAEAREKEKQRVSQSNAADSQWSKRYRVMVQLTPCVKRDLIAFMQAQHQKDITTRLAHGEEIPEEERTIDFATLDANIGEKYMKYYDSYMTQEQQKKKEQEEIQVKQIMDDNKQTTTTIQTSTTQKDPSHYHSPDLIRSPYQEGTLYTEQYTKYHAHHHDDDVESLQTATETTPPPPLETRGYISSHLIHRDFLPTDWVEENHIVHVEHINNNLQQRLYHDEPINGIPPTDKNTPEFEILKDGDDSIVESTNVTTATTNTATVLLPDQLQPEIAQHLDTFTNQIGLPSIDDVRAPFTHMHASQLYIQPPTLSAHEHKQEQHTQATLGEPQSAREIPPLIPVDLTNPSKDVDTPAVLNTIQQNPQKLQQVHNVLNKIPTSALRAIRDTSEYRILPPGAPKPPDNDDDEAEGAEVKRSDAFSATDLQKHFHTNTQQKQHQKQQINAESGAYKYFSSLMSADGISLAPFNWINAKIQLLEQVMKLHVMGKMEQRLVKTVYRKGASMGASITPNFNLIGIGPNQMSTIGKLLIYDTTNQSNIPHTRILPKNPQDGNVVNVHTANIFIADDNKFTAPETIRERQHPLLWTSHRMLLKANTEETQHPMVTYHDASLITPKRVVVNDNNNDNGNNGEKQQQQQEKIEFVKKLPHIPALQPYELECGCMLPYTTPMPRHLKNQDGEQQQQENQNDNNNNNNTSNNPTITINKPTIKKQIGVPKIHNPKSLLNHLPPSAPHPFIPTNYLYESTFENDMRGKFVPGRNILSLPQDVPAQVLKELDAKEQQLRQIQLRQEELKTKKFQDKQTIKQYQRLKAQNEAIPEELEAKVLEIQQEQERHEAEERLMDADEKRMKQRETQQLKAEMNSARVVDFNPEIHNTAVENRFGSLTTSVEFNPAIQHTSGVELPDINFGDEMVAKKPYVVSHASPNDLTATNTTKYGGSEAVCVAQAKQGAKEATTLYRMSHLNLNKNTAVFNAKLLSGRTHQLRIHFSDAGLPIRGDAYYNPYYIKHWMSTFFYSYYQRMAYNSHIRSIYMRPLFGHADAGVTSQLVGVDTWKGLLTPVTQFGESLVKNNNNNTNDGDDKKNLKLLQYNIYNPSIQYQNQTNNSFEHMIPQSPMHAYPISELNERFGADNANKIAKFQQENQEKEQQREFSPEELEYYLNIYKTFADTPVDGEMFLQSYMIEFPLPEALSRPRSVRKDARRAKHSTMMQQRLLGDLNNSNNNNNVDGDNNNVNNNTEEPENNNNDDSNEQQQQDQDTNNKSAANIIDPEEKAKVLEQLEKYKQTSRIGTKINPKLSDGLPLYHARMSPEEVKAERERKRKEKQLYREKKLELEQIMTDCVATGIVNAKQFDSLLTIQTDGSGIKKQSSSSSSSSSDGTTVTTTGSNNPLLSQKQTTETLAKIYKETTIDFIDNHQSTHQQQAEQFYQSPDDLDGYLLSSSSENLEQQQQQQQMVEINNNDNNNQIVPSLPHPDGFYDIRPLFSSKRSPLWDSINTTIQSEEFKKQYDPTQQLSASTLHHSPQLQPDAQIVVKFQGKEIKTQISNVLHLSTEYKSWTYKTKDDIQMVRILLGVPTSWGYAM